MLLPNILNFLRPFSTSRNASSSSSLNWRIQRKQKQLASQVSLILLQRHNWLPLLQNFNLSSKLTQPLFLQILFKTQHNPSISLNFFNWVKSKLGFEPTLNSYLFIIQISLQSGLVNPIKPHLVSVLENNPASSIIDSTIQACTGKDSESISLSFIMEYYSRKDLFVDALEVFDKMRAHAYYISIRACNALLEALWRQHRIKDSWCFFGAMLRNEVILDKQTWSLVGQILCKDGKFERITKFLELGIYNSRMYNLIVDCYSGSGRFEDAFELLVEMCDRKIDPGFGTYCSILDGACKHRDLKVIDRVVHVMIEKELLPKSLSEYDSIIRKLCELGKTNAAVMFFKRACDDMVQLQDDTYGRILEASSNGGNIDEAVSIYRTISERDLKVPDSNYHAFVNVIFKGAKARDVCDLLKDLIRRGFCPFSYELSRFLASQCRKRRWKEVEDLMNIIMEKGLTVDSVCCGLLVKHYCSRRNIDSAIELHKKMENLNFCLDLKTYHLLLNVLFASSRAEEARRVFDYMKRLSIVSSQSFRIMIEGLCGEREMREAMKVHDEMLKMGLKPDKATYKHLISGFK